MSATTWAIIVYGALVVLAVIIVVVVDVDAGDKK